MKTFTLKINRALVIKKTKLFTLFLALLASVGTICAESGTCGDNLTWDLTDGVLTISGSGAMTDWSWDEYTPWNAYLWDIATVTIGNGVTSIGNRAFYDCVSLNSVIIPNSVTSIGMYAFHDCSGLTSIEIPNNVTSIGDFAFNGCSGLTRVTIPNSVTNIGRGAFDDCSGLKDPIFNDYLFAYMPATYEGEYVVKEGINIICGGAFSHCSKLTKVTLPNSLKEIREDAFFGCSAIETIFIPKNVETISIVALATIDYASKEPDYSSSEIKEYFISNLQSITVDKDNKNFTSIDGVLYDKDAKTLIQYPTGKKGPFTIPNSVQKVGTAACAYGKMTEVTFPSSVEVIETAAFVSSFLLQDIHFSENLKEIQQQAFAGCIHLKHIALPNNLTKINDHTFGSCINIQDLTIGSNIAYIGEDAFSFDIAECNSITCLADIVPYVKENFISGLYARRTADGGIDYDVIEDMSAITIYVPYKSVTAYREDANWGKFTIKPLEATPADVTDVVITPTTSTIDIAWPKVNDAYTYEIVIKDQAGNIVCTLIFDAEGHLLSLAFNAPSQDKAPQREQTAGFSFTITGLKSGTAYTYTLTAKNEQGVAIDTKNGSFTTEGPQAIDQITKNQLQMTNKVIRDGQLLIQRGDELFNAQGARVK